MTRKYNNILGINISHDGAVCLLKNGRIAVAIQEERLARIKGKRISLHEKPLGIEYCLEAGNLTIDEIDLIVICVLRSTPDDIVFFRTQLGEPWSDVPIITVSHHLAHAISTFQTSGFQESAVLVVDGVGSTTSALSVEEQEVIRPHKYHPGEETISMYFASGKQIQPLEKIVAASLGQDGEWLERRTDMVAAQRSMPKFNSLGGLFSAVSVQVFGNINHAGKVMGLAPYGRPIIPVNDFLSLQNGRVIFRSKVCSRFYDIRPWPANRAYYRDLAASAQAALNHAILYLVQRLKILTQADNLCLAGGVALNGITNQKIFRSKLFKKIHILPASDDSGVAIGAAYFGYLQSAAKKKIQTKSYTSDFWGKGYSNKTIEIALSHFPGIIFENYSKSALLREATDSLLKGKVIGWFNGRSEFGPRALGNRSILMDPRIQNAPAMLNAIKGRELFRPFAPAILKEKAAEWFELNETEPDSDFMMRIVPFKPSKSSLVPGVVHVDGTGRYQTVSSKNGLFYHLIKQFEEHTGIPILLNTSFNIFGQPIVESPEDALLCFLFSKLHGLVIGNYFVQRQPSFATTDLSFVLASNAMHKPSKVDLKRNHLMGQFKNFEITTKRGTIIAKLGDLEQRVLNRLEIEGLISKSSVQKFEKQWFEKESLTNSMVDYDKAFYKLCSIGLIAISEVSIGQT